MRRRVGLVTARGCPRATRHEAHGEGAIYCAYGETIDRGLLEVNHQKISRPVCSREDNKYCIGAQRHATIAIQLYR